MPPSSAPRPSWARPGCSSTAPACSPTGRRWTCPRATGTASWTSTSRASSSARRPPCAACCRGRRTHHQHLVHRGTGRAAHPDRLLRRQGRRGPLHALPRRRGGQRGHHRQLRGAGHDPLGHARTGHRSAAAARRTSWRSSLTGRFALPEDHAGPRGLARQRRGRACHRPGHRRGRWPVTVRTHRAPVGTGAGTGRQPGVPAGLRSPALAGRSGRRREAVTDQDWTLAGQASLRDRGRHGHRACRGRALRAGRGQGRAHRPPGRSARGDGAAHPRCRWHLPRDPLRRLEGGPGRARPWPPSRRPSAASTRWSAWPASSSWASATTASTGVEHVHLAADHRRQPDGHVPDLQARHARAPRVGRGLHHHHRVALRHAGLLQRPGRLQRQQVRHPRARARHGGRPRSREHPRQLRHPGLHRHAADGAGLRGSGLARGRWRR